MGLFQGLANEIEALASDFTGNCQDLLGTKKSNILPKISVEIFFKLAHFFSHFRQCNPISNIHPKHTDHCFQFFSNQTWSITNITRMPQEYADFKRMIKPIPPQLVDRIDYDNEGNLLQYAVRMNQVGYLQILIDYGLDPMAPLAFRRPNMSPLEQALEGGNMEVWNLLKDHIEMTAELKLEQLNNMITTVYRYREEPHTEFKELLSSLPVESVKPFRIIAMGDPPMTSTLLQVAAMQDNKEAVLLLLEHGVDPKETSDVKRTPMKIAADNNYEEIVEILREAIGEEIPDDVKLSQLSKAMYEDDPEKAKNKFRELLSSLSPELVSSTSVNNFGSVLQDAVLEGKIDFIRILLEHGVDPAVGTDTKEETSIEIASNRDSTEVLTLLAEFTELPTDIKIKQLKLLVERDEENNIDIFKKQLESLSVDQLGAARIQVRWQPYGEWKDATLLQCLANLSEKESKLELLKLLLNHGLDPMAVSEEVIDTPLEIVAFGGNTKAFDLLSPHYEENTKKQIAQLLIWALTDKAPSAAFILLFQSVPLAEVNSCTMLGFNLLQNLAAHGDTAHLAFLLQQGVDPEGSAEASKCAMHLAWQKDHVGTMTELAKYTEADPDVRTSSVWLLVEREQERRWQKDVLSLLQNQQKEMEKQTSLLKLIARASGAEVED